MSGQQPERRAEDGPVKFAVHGEHTYSISVTHNGKEQDLIVGAHNAWRLFGMMAMILGIALPAAIAKRIKL